MKTITFFKRVLASAALVSGHRRADPLLYCIILPAEEILGKGAGKIPQTP